MTTLYNQNIGGGNKVTTRKIRTGLRIPYEINTKLITIAREKGISKNALVLQILWDWIERKEQIL